jgi:hypothetical protein
LLSDRGNTSSMRCVVYLLPCRLAAAAVPCAGSAALPRPPRPGVQPVIVTAAQMPLCYHQPLGQRQHNKHCMACTPCSHVAYCCCLCGLCSSTIPPLSNLQLVTPFFTAVELAAQLARCPVQWCKTTHNA